MVAFSKSHVTADGRIYIAGDKLTAPLDFSNSMLEGIITLEGTTRPLDITSPIFLNDINSGKDLNGKVRMKNVLIPTLYADNSRFKEFDISEVHGGLHRPIRLTGFSDFRGTKFEYFNASGAEFTNNADFTNAEFRNAVNFERTKLRQPALLKWYQLDHKLKTSDGEDLSKESYEELERNFHAVNDLESENECNYAKRLHFEGHTWEWWLLGFEVRRRMPFICLILCCLVLTVLNCWVVVANPWQITDSSEKLLNALPLPPALLVLKSAMLDLSFPETYVGKLPWRIVFLAESFALKFLIGCLLITIAHTSPLLKDLLPYLGVK